ncbi:sensor histidine kinase [Streptomyces sp. YC537]|uniref:Sensor histidine kinase n=2 Tax=Streptomyces boluensis TaxID=1775135 RepID=A0A964XN76_9ACTN|nr:sensor histidine kinase [Streptomyces boluensis]
MDLYTRGTVYFLVWWNVPIGMALTVTRPVRHAAPAALIIAVLLVSVAQGYWGTKATKAGFRVYLDDAPVPRRELLVSCALMVVQLAGLLVLGGLTGPTRFPLFPTALACAVLPLLVAYSLTVPVRISLVALLGVTAPLCGVLWLMNSGGRTLIAILITILVVGAWIAGTVRLSAWGLGVMYELRTARDVQARLAVAEERLRFGRDLHDVLGRNLAVVALKSELAVQLARRDRPEAVEQMIEVQRIAQDSQREVREVVRGYREVGLGAELAGAQGVLKAAGIDCRVLGTEAADALPPAVHAALGWVVREAATNVLRHGDADRCTVALRVTGQEPATAVLTVENNGAGQAPAPGASSGSGLVGLRERLSAVDGVLEAGPAAGGHFKLTAEVPLPGPTAPAVPRPGTAPHGTPAHQDRAGAAGTKKRSTR